MGNGINQNISGTDTITAIISLDTFVSLDPNLQNKIIDTVHNDKDKDGGILGKLLGAKRENASIHIGFIICVLFTIILVLELIHSYCIEGDINMDFINVIVPVITLSIGYIFGKGSN